MTKFTKVDAEQVRKLGELARLKLSDAETSSFAGQLDEVLGYADRIRALDTEGVVPTSHALLEAGLEGTGVLRDDEPVKSLDREQVLERAPDAGGGLFKVPKVLP
jgi:aspartyl-tRNA(Asn)/glutamyl-tRNA(Gln) amidotransferase subunit C